MFLACLGWTAASGSINSGGWKAAPGCLRAGKGDAGMGRNRMKACERKDETITVRCTAEEKADLKEMAGKRGESVGRFLLDAGMAGRERSREKDRRQVYFLTELTQRMDACYRCIQSDGFEKEAMKEELDRVMEGVDRLWEI